MSGSDQNRSTRLLSDAPADADSFEGGHERVAEAIAGLIQDEEGGKAIALSGPYGSGKSTVVRLLKNEMHDIDQTEREDTRIFTYDAWEHQGDPLRRSFIEGIVEFLEHEGWCDKDRWESEIESIAQRREKTKLKTEPVLTKWGRKVGIALFFSPLGLAGFAVFLRALIYELQNSYPSAFWIITFSIFTLLSFCLFVYPLIQVKRAKSESDDEDRKSDDSEEGADPFHLFFQKTRKEVETKTIRTPDPTTIEFQKVFCKIVSDALCDSNRQLIIVVDNLDRLSAERALSTWATMRTFFDHGNGNEPDWMSRFWLIVPLNFGALEETFEKHKVNGEKRKDASGAPSEVEGARQNGNTETKNDTTKHRATERPGKSSSLRAFADKTFNTVFRVAPPILSDWEQFMKEQLVEAFDLSTSESESERTFHAVYRVYRAEATRGNGIPTPRDIKVFINHLSSLFRQWGHQIGLPTLAAYQLVSQQISQNGAELVQPDWLPEDIRRELRGEDWQKKLAALHFNVHPDRAIEVLIGEKVQTALETGDRDALREYSEIRGFESILDTTLSLVTSEKNPSAAALSAFALEGITIEDTSVGEKAWRQLRSVTAAAEDWYPDEEKKGEGLVSVLRHAPEGVRDTLTDNIVRPACSYDLKVGPEIDLPNDATDWTDGMLPIVLELQNHTSFRENFHVPPNWPSFISIMARLSDHDSAHLAHLFSLTPGMTEGGIDQAVANLLEAQSLGIEHINGIRLAKHVNGVDKDKQWEATTQQLQEALSWNAGVETDYQHSCLELAIIIEEEILDQQTSSIGNYLLSSQGRADVFHHLYQHQDDNSGEFATLCFLVRLLYSVNSNRGTNSGNASKGYGLFTKVLQTPDHAKRDPFVKGVAELVEKFDIINQLLKVANHDIADDFIAEVICTLSEREVRSKIFTYDVICDHADIIGKALSEDQEAFRDIVIQADSGGELSARLREVDQDEWLNKLKEDSKLLEIVLALASETEIRLSVDFKDALLEHAVWTIEQGKKSQQMSENRGSQILTVLSSDVRKSFLSSLQRKLVRECGDRKIAAALLMYETALYESNVIGGVKITDPDRFANESFKVLIEAGNAEELKWLHHVLQAKPNLKNDVEESTWGTFKETVRVKCSGLKGEAASQIEKIAETIGVELDDFEDDHDESIEK